MIKNITCLFSILSWLFFVIPCYAAGGLETAMVDLSTQLAQYVSTPKKLTIGVIEFQNLSCKNTNMEKFLCEELTNQLFLTKKFKVIEKSQLDKVIVEQKLSLTQLVDTGNASRIGKILGADGILIGSVVEKDGSIVINARIVSVAQGELLSTANVNIPIDKQILILQGRAIPPEPQTPGSIVVVSDIENAEILLDNVLCGVIVNRELLIPNVLPANHKITLQKDDRAFTKKVEVKEGKEERVTLLTGLILITCKGEFRNREASMENADVYLENRKIGKINRGQLQISNLIPGNYEIRIEKPYYQHDEKTVMVSEAETCRTTMGLKRFGLGRSWRWWLVSSTIPAEAAPNKNFDSFTGKHTEIVKETRMISVHLPNILRQIGEAEIGYFTLGELTGLQIDINKLYFVTWTGPCEVYFQPGLFCGFLGGMHWIRGTGHNEIPKDTALISPNMFYGYQASVIARILLSTNFSLIGSVGYCNYLGCNDWELSQKDENSSNKNTPTWDLPPEWRQYPDVKIGGMAIKVGLVF